jgi:hypothetical protein
MISKTFADPSDDDLLRSLLSKHGIFAELFFHRSIRERASRRFAEASVDLQQFQSLLSVAEGYDIRLGKNPSYAVYFIVDHIYQQALFRAITDSRTYAQLEVWFRESRKWRACSLCGNEFRVIDLPDWVYFGSSGYTLCCFQCPIVEAPRKGELLTLIPAFVRSCGFIPSADAKPTNYAFTSRLASDAWAGVFLAYGKMGGIDHVHKKFGSWFRGLAQTGVLPDGVLSTSRGIRCLAQDGHVCRSLDEQRIDDWLSAHGLSHEVEPGYPAHPSLNRAGRRRGDWRVHNTFIEYFGLVGDPNYEKKMDEKILLARHLGVDLIAIYPSDLERLDLKLGCLFKG